MPAEETHSSLPGTLYLETTNRCNLRCKACILYRGNWEPDRDMSLRDLCMITAQLPELKSAVLHGIGEPLLNRALPGMIRHLKKRGVEVRFNSNGILLNEKWQQDLMETGLDELRISLDAASGQGYRAVRGSDRFDQIVCNLKSFIRLQQERGALRPKLSLWFLGYRDNILELPEVIGLAADIGIPEVYLQRLVYFQDDEGYGIARADKSLQNSANHWLKWIQKGQRLARERGIRFEASGRGRAAAVLRDPAEAGTERPWQHCYRPDSLIYITANGNVLPCCISPFSTSDYASIVLGNVFERALAEIWTGAAYRNFRQKRRTASPPRCCRACGLGWSL